MYTLEREFVMKREITPDMYNYNKFPGPKFEHLDKKVSSEKVELTLVEDYRNAFDLVRFEQRFSMLMLKFDYIVGDWGNDQLRLRGFYRDDKPVDNSLKISRLQDYLLEYCNYGCAYFVLENNEPKEMPSEEGRTRKNRHHRRQKTTNQHFEHSPAEAKTVRKQQEKRRHKQKNQKADRHFNIKNERIDRKKDEKQDNHTGKRGFVIRQK